MQQPKPISAAPSYHPEFAEVARKLALVGATDEEMAWQFKVPLGTLHDWLASVPEFAQAVQYGRTGDANVVEGLYQIATGCFPEVVTNPVGVKKEPLTCIRHRPPNRHARKFWLMNRRPGEWAQKAEIEPDPSRAAASKLTRSGLPGLVTGLAAVQGSATDG